MWAPSMFLVWSLGQGADGCSNLADSVRTLTAADPSRAVVVARRIDRECRHDFDALFTAGRAVNRVARFEEAAQDQPLREIAARLLDRSVQLRPRNAAAWFEFGVAIKKRGGLQVDAYRAINRALELADQYPDSAPPILLAEIQSQRARHLQDWVDRFRGLKRVEGIPIATPSCSNLGMFCENYIRPLNFNEQLREAPPLAVDVAEQRDQLIHLYRVVLRLDPSQSDAAERLGREFVLEGEWELLAGLAREERGRHTPGVFQAVEGLAVHRLGRLQRADSLFRAAIATMPDSLRRWYESPPPPLDTVPDFWIRGRPLWLAPFNELTLEYWARLTAAFLVLRDREADVQGPETPQGDALIRYGWPAMVTQIDRRGSTLISPEQMAAVIATALDCWDPQMGGGMMLPPCGAADPGYIKDPGGGRWVVWTYAMDRPSLIFEQRPGRRVPRYVFDGAAEAHAEDLRRETPLAFKSRFASRQFHLPIQVTRFRGANPNETTVHVHSVVTTAQLGLPPQDSVDVGLFLFSDGPGFAPVAERRASYAAGTGIGLSYQVPLAAGRYAYSLEALAEGYGAAATARDSLVAPRWAPDSLLISDLWVAHQVTPWVDGEPVAVRELVVEPSRTLEVAPGTRVWVVWEAYGVTPDERGNGTYQVTLTLQDAAQRSLPVRALRRLGVGAPQEAARLEWQSVRRLSADGRALEYVELALPATRAGEFRLAVTVRAGGREATAIRRLVVVAPQANPR